MRTCAACSPTSRRKRSRARPSARMAAHAVPSNKFKGRPMVTCGAPPTTDEMVRELWDRQHIGDVMLRFGRGLDPHDWDMYAATLTDPFEVDFFDLTGRAPATTTPKIWARFASACLERLIVMHQYSNFHINLHGDVADGIFYHVSRHRYTNRFADHHYTQYGW